MSEPASLSLSLVGFLFSVVAIRYGGASQHNTKKTESESTTVIDSASSSAHKDEPRAVDAPALRPAEHAP